MPTEVPVTPSQVRAAQRIVERNAATGRATPEAIRKIAEATAQPLPGEPEPRTVEHVHTGRPARKRRRYRHIPPGQPKKRVDEEEVSSTDFIVFLEPRERDAEEGQDDQTANSESDRGSATEDVANHPAKE
jgi:hypothetical protein